MGKEEITITRPEEVKQLIEVKTGLEEDETVEAMILKNKVKQFGRMVTRVKDDQEKGISVPIPKGTLKTFFTLLDLQNKDKFGTKTYKDMRRKFIEAGSFDMRMQNLDRQLKPLEERFQKGVVEKENAKKMKVLEDLESQAHTAEKHFTRSTLELGRIFCHIKREKLFLLRGVKTFGEYADGVFIISPQYRASCMKIYDMYESIHSQLESNPKYEPENPSVLLDLKRLDDPEERFTALKEATDQARKADLKLTKRMVRNAVIEKMPEEEVEEDETETAGKVYDKVFKDLNNILSAVREHRDTWNSTQRDMIKGLAQSVVNSVYQEK